MQEEGHESQFTNKQTRILAFLQQSRALLDNLYRSHTSGKFVLLYPRRHSRPISDVGPDNERPRSRSRSAPTRASGNSGDLRIINVPEEMLNQDIELDEGSLSKVLGFKLGETVTHLERLKLRIQDKSSKILVTGDVNSGKSTFVNALLRRDLLPTDQQPCTQSFCEIIPVQRAEYLGESQCVHAISDYDSYSVDRPNTYKVMGLPGMRELVQDEESYYQLFRIFLPEEETPTGILHNGLVDISLIDSPGLNSDLFKTMSLFAKQEDIDVVVFLVNAANHLTLSAREFLETAGREKSYIFTVVNKFDDIKNREKCRRMVLGQIQEVLPQTYDEGKNLIHFVSAGKFLSSCSAEGSPDSAKSVEMKAIGETDSMNAEFLHLEKCLGDFILEKRTKSKLLPAQTFILCVLGEVSQVLEYNKRRRDEDLSRVTRELEIISPCFDQLMAHHGFLQADLRRVAGEVTDGIYRRSREHLMSFSPADWLRKVKWPGTWGLYDFKRAVHTAIGEQAGVWLESTQASAVSATTSGIHLLHATASSHSAQIFSEASHETEQEVGGLFKTSRPAAQEIPEIATLALLDMRTELLNSGTWLGAATIASAIFGYRSIASLAFRLFDLSRSGSRLATKLLLLGSGLVAVVLIMSDIEEICRKNLRRHYEVFFASPAWLHEEPRRLQESAQQTLNTFQMGLVSKFETALHQQRQLRAEKDLQRCQLETLQKYLGEQIQATSNLLNSLRSIHL